MRVMQNLPISRHPTLKGVRNLLGSTGLPSEDLCEPQLEHFFFVGAAEAPTALVGAEMYGEYALLRSLAVAANQRKHGLGSQLVAHLEQHVRESGVRQIFLLTTTAEDFFARRGYESLERKFAPLSIQKTREFAEICPASSAFMAKALTG
jgi:amino-acid N-acetyltransferase